MLEEHLESTLRQRREQLRRQLDRSRFRTDASYFDAVVKRAISAGQTAK